MMELSKAQRMLLGLAIGDALGAGYEGASQGSHRLSKQVPHQYPRGTGVYTDNMQ